MDYLRAKFSIILSCVITDCTAYEFLTPESRRHLRQWFMYNTSVTFDGKVVPSEYHHLSSTDDNEPVSYGTSCNSKVTRTSFDEKRPL